LILVKGIAGGIVATIVMWCVILSFYTWRLDVVAKQQGMTGLMAVAGGWTYLLHMPLVLILLTAAFGGGLYLTAR
jgi:hypothetical protein